MKKTIMKMRYVKAGLLRSVGFVNVFKKKNCGASPHKGEIIKILENAVKDLEIVHSI